MVVSLACDDADIVHLSQARNAGRILGLTDSANTQDVHVSSARCVNVSPMGAQVFRKYRPGGENVGGRWMASSPVGLWWILSASKPAHLRAPTRHQAVIFS